MRATKRQRFTGAIVTVTVGSDGDQRTFGAHETLLKQASKFFQAALKGEWKEAKTRTINMPEDNADAAEIYFDWLYSGEVTSRASDELMGRDQHERESILLAKAYVFGEKVQDDDFCNAVIVAITELLDQRIAVTETRYGLSEGYIEAIYAGTPAGSPARALVVDVTAHYGSRDWMGVYRETCLKYPEFAIELATALLSEKGICRDDDKVFDKRTQWFKKKPEENTKDNTSR